jgi:glycosyltransferase involved in cell wall biosynthesis
LHWQFYYAKRNSFYPPDYENAGLGGSEASIVVLSRALAARGHQVEVFNCCYRPGVYDGVTWRQAWELADAATPDVAVAVRFEESLWPRESVAPRYLFWMLDDRTSGPASFTERFGDLGGMVVVASEAMRRRLDAAQVEVPTVTIPLPVEIERYRGPTGDRRSVCLFSSMPNRGLDVALSIWPAIRAAVHDAELWVTGGWQLWGFTSSEAEDRWNQILGTAPLPAGVRLLGPVSRTELVSIQQRAALTFYPCRFPEMFCLAAAESAAAGTPVVASATEALLERIEHNHTGLLIPGDISSPVVKSSFAQAVTTLLTDRNRLDRLARNARQSVSQLVPDRVARAWETLVD